METKIAILETNMAEVKKEISESRKEMKEGFDKLEKRLNCYVKKDIYNLDMKRLTKIEGMIDKIVWVVVLSFIAALISLVIK